MKVYQGTTDCAAEEVGYDSGRLDAVNNFFARMIEKNIIFGVSYRPARKGKVFAAASLGSRHYNNPDLPMMPDTVYGLASQTKAFAAVSIFMLAEDGLISVDDNAGKYLAQFADAPFNEITLLHLLTHTSGLYPEGSIPVAHHIGAYEHIESEWEKSGDDTDRIAAGLRGGMRRKPGEEWQYCS
ncbi:MAG: beta-lactamase family protein [Defluviitaleaceae bacterium]|nr:beta-lactamase family protein [Defluviitaleaceae bacterium]